MGCLQFFFGASGTIQSFNYKSDARTNEEPHHLANLNYAICIRGENGYCGIRYSQITTDPYSFTLSNDATASKYNEVLVNNDLFLLAWMCPKSFREQVHLRHHKHVHGMSLRISVSFV